MAIIEFFISFNRHTVPYADFFVRTALSRISHKHEVRFRATTHPDTPVPLNITVVDLIYNHDTINGRYAMNAIYPAIGFNKGQKHISQDCDIFMMAHVDMCMVLNSWDDEVVKILSEFDICGNKYPSDSFTYQNYPGIDILFMKSDILKQNSINFMPFVGMDTDKPLCKIVTDEAEAYLTGKKIGDPFYLEAGWQLPFIIRRDKYKTALIDFVVPAGQHYGEYYWDNKLFCSHLGGCNHKDFNSQFVQDFIKKYG